MSELAYNINGEGFEPPETTTADHPCRTPPRARRVASCGARAIRADAHPAATHKINTPLVRIPAP